MGVPKKKKRGRKPIELTEDRIDKFVQAIRLGCPIKDACGCAGFSERWFYLQKSKAEKAPQKPNSKKFIQFLQHIKEAEGLATQRWLAIIEKAAQGGQWQAAAWKLERRRAMFIPKVKAEVEATVDARVEVKDARERVLDKLALQAKRIAEDEDSQ